MIRSIYLAVIMISVILISGCNGGNASEKEGQYETTKKMVVDILQTEDGKKALREIMTDDTMKQELVMESDVVKKSINEALVSEKGKEMWTKLFQDTDFVKEYTKSMKDEHIKLIKSLMNDADYQKQMLELLQNPEMTEQMLEVVKSQQFRAHLEETIQQTLETPLFQEKMQETLLKAAEKQSKGQQQKGGGGSEEGNQEEQGSESGGGSGGGQ
ncbi:spore gernimation protein GerD [Virgibacillus sp. AGTR]|uniref:spore germination lipoprotein GerD n=1 Tax=Virgibacillus sp. AGTR TaxID=2812055 RepID=UPI0019650272|nr:spore germination lipoprotein GerD [Virgibacillus sp. AGTR]MCC2252210.1 spore gernimation protein GerD [Virgibacillus sp. AGTR]QRZ19214.1 spore gernimation protein GerD [Virgibacillus sp. AGTR]